MGRLVLIALAAALAWPRVAAAEPVESSAAVDGTVTAVAAVGAVALTLVPVDTTARWAHEPFGALDRSLRGRYSATASAYSDLTLATALTAPLLLEVGRGFDAQTDDRLLVYGESVMATALLTNLVKYTVQRPRPYVYREDPRLGNGKSAHLSFYSGHAALAFAAATAGGYLYAAQSTDRRAREAVWFSGLAVASATAMLRVRAGKHFYSDVLIGAAAGAAVGLAVPRLHHAGGIELGAGEWAAIGGGVLVGALAAGFAPFPEDVKVTLQPLVLAGGGGLSLAGVLE